MEDDESHASFVPSTAKEQELYDEILILASEVERLIIEKVNLVIEKNALQQELKAVERKPEKHLV